MGVMGETGAFSDDEFAALTGLLRRFADSALDQHDGWRLDTARGPVYVRITREVPFGENAEAYRVLSPTTAGEGLSDSGHDQMIERIEKALFRTTRMQPGYDERDVDTFLDEAVAALRRGELPDAPGARFGTTRIRPGYNEMDVDDLLDEIERYCDARRR